MTRAAFLIALLLSAAAAAADADAELEPGSSAAEITVGGAAPQAQLRVRAGKALGIRVAGPAVVKLEVRVEGDPPAKAIAAAVEVDGKVSQRSSVKPAAEEGAKSNRDQPITKPVALEVKVSEGQHTVRLRWPSSASGDALVGVSGVKLGPAGSLAKAAPPLPLPGDAGKKVAAAPPLGLPDMDLSKDKAAPALPLPEAKQDKAPPALPLPEAKKEQPSVLALPEAKKEQPPALPLPEAKKEQPPPLPLPAAEAKKEAPAPPKPAPAAAAAPAPAAPPAAAAALPAAPPAVPAEKPKPAAATAAAAPPPAAPTPGLAARASDLNLRGATTQRALWNVRAFVGEERSTESNYTDPSTLTRLGLEATRWFAGAFLARLEFDWRNSTQQYVPLHQTGSGQRAVAVSENRYDVAGNIGYDVGSKMVSSGRFELTPLLGAHWVALKNDAFPSDVVGVDMGGRTRFYLSPSVIPHAQVTYTYNFSSPGVSKQNSALSSPKGDVVIRAGLALPLTGGYALELDYQGDVLSFENTYRVAHGAALGFGSSF